MTGFLFDENRFYLAGDQDQPLAEIHFERVGSGLLVIDHTFTDPALRGQGIARKLVERTARYAREEGFKVKATCPYAKKVLREEAFSDIYTE